MERLTKSGSILLLSLWVLALMGLIAASLSFRLGLAHRLTQYSWDELRLRQAAKTAVVLFAVDWKRDRASYAAFNQAWRASERVEAAEDESGKINVNTAPREVLERLFVQHSEVVPAILAWRTPGTARTSASDPYEPMGYTARHGAFQTLEELLLVNGMTPSIYSEVHEALTVYSAGPVNINTASASVLEALGLPASLAAKILTFRRGPDDLEGTRDDGIFTSVASIIPRLKEKMFLSTEDQKVLRQFVSQNRFTVQAESFRLQIVARLPDSRLEGRYAVVTSARFPGRILYWREF